MKAKEFIAEVFNSDVSGKVVRATPDLFITTARIGNRDIRFTAAGDGNNEWEIGFIERSDKGDTFYKTGSGNELRVFSFVIESIKMLVAKYAPLSVVFTSEESDGNRSSLYSRMSNRVNIPGYQLQTKKTGPTDAFVFTRIDK